MASGLSRSVEAVINRNTGICGELRSKGVDRPECSKGPKPSCLGQLIAEVTLRGNGPGVDLVDYEVHAILF